jgi:hypothetical protein
MFHFTSHVVLFCLLVAPLCRASDLKITVRSTTRGFPARTSTTYISGRRTRTETKPRPYSGFQAWNGGPTVFSYGHRNATIYQCDTRWLMFLDLDSQEYTSVEIDEQGRPTNPRPMGTPMPMQPSGATLTINIEDIDTGERKVMFGYTARHIIRTEKRLPSPGSISLAQETRRDGWYIDLNRPEGCPPRLQNTRSEAFVLVSGGLNGKMDKIEVHHTGVTELGYPVEVSDSSFSKTELIELSTTPLDPALFEVQPGFKQVAMLTVNPPQPPSSKLLRVWAWVWQSIRGKFGRGI